MKRRKGGDGPGGFGERAKIKTHMKGKEQESDGIDSTESEKFQVNNRKEISKRKLR